MSRLQPFLHCLLWLSVLTATAASGLAQEQSLDATLEPVRSQFGLPALGAAVARDGRIVAAGVVGTRILGRNLPAALDDRFHLGSDTKAMTATLAGMMVDEGKLRWDSTIGAVLGADIPNLNPKFATITLEQLLSHSSGIPSDNDEIAALYFANPDAYDYDLTALRRRIIGDWGSRHEPKVPEGSPFQYSNLGYIVVGAMIEKVSGEPWDNLMQRRIFAPLGLNTAGLGPQATFGLYDAPVGHKVDGDKATPMPWGPASDAPAVVGPAGIAHMSVRDFARWASWNAAGGRRGPQLVKPETLERIHRAHVKTPVIANPKPGTPKTGEYALGWGIVTFDWTGKPVLTHNGSNSMNLATVFIQPDIDLAIVAATNFPGEKADLALLEIIETLYRQFAPKPR
ncbi:MAG: beta-lactamase family protein [Pseudorhodoplanes sp.]|nr:beta-lactamase family protein [Pseudorhodoplanes sp.]